MLENLKAARKHGFRFALLQALNFASSVAFGLMIWKGLGIAFNTESPIVVVLKFAFAICCCS